MRNYLETFFILGSLAASGCVAPLPRLSGVTARQARVVEPFAAIQVQSGLNAAITGGPSEAVTVVGDENLVGLVSTTVAGGQLTVSLAEPFGAPSSAPLQIQIVASPTVGELTTSGGAQLSAGGLLGGALRLDASGASTLTVSGTTRQLGVTASGAAHVEARELAAEDVTLSGSGASLAEVCAARSLDVHLSGASRALYSCSPARVNTDLNGGSTADAE
jgi:hypothetical protein